MPHRTLGSVIVSLLLVLGAACGSDSEADEGFRPEPVPLQATTTTTAPAPVHLTQTVTATVPELEVFAVRPGGPEQPVLAQPASVAPIPRVGLNSAGTRKTDEGWAFSNPTYFGNPLTMVVTENAGEWLR
jgi:hypothetical protein